MAEGVEAAIRPEQAVSTFLRPDEMRTLGALTETLIPTDDHSPGALAAGVPEWIDAYLAESDESRKEFWRTGLAGLNHLASQSCGKGFAECSPEQQVELLRRVSAGEEHPTTPEEKFFVALKHATIDGYYSSKVGIHQDLEYQGNTALAEFPIAQTARKNVAPHSE
jgi:hypothetical protein